MGVIWNDPQLAVFWPLRHSAPIVFNKTAFFSFLVVSIRHFCKYIYVDLPHALMTRARQKETSRSNGLGLGVS